jgi:hypothetical protein
VLSEPLQIPHFEESDIDIKIDGILDEELWESIPWYDNLSVVDPDTLEDAPLQTRIRYFYTSKGLYIGVWNQQDKETLVSRLSSRDQFISRDDISITLDPSGQGLYGYWFGVGLGGSLLDGTVLPERQYSKEWDGPWNGASAEVEGGWSAEMFLPWSMMTMPDTTDDSRQIGFYVAREVAHIDERWGWPALPRTKSVFMSQLQKMELKGINPRQQFTFYPYASTTYDNIEGQDTYKAGFDFFWRPSSNLQLTSTINPDFGSVESDNVVVNLSSFETFFPEKRPFFLEGQDIFITSPRARGGRNSRGPPTTLINTRRIGSAPKSIDIPDFDLPTLEANRPTELIGAMKITGQNGKLRYGALAAIEDETKLTGTINDVETDVVQDGRDFGAARFLFEETSGGERRSIGWMSTIVAHPQEDAITHGLDAHYLSNGGIFGADVQLMYSDVDNVTGSGGFIDFNYTPRQGRKHSLSLDYFDDSLDINDFGFLRRNDAIGARYSYRISESDRPNLKSRFTRFSATQQYNTEGMVVRSGLFAAQDRQFHNNSSLFTQLNYFPERWDDINSNGNGSFRIEDRWQTGAFWNNNEANVLNLGVGAFYTGEDLGGYTAEIVTELTWHPTTRFSLVFEIAYEDKNGWLIHESDRDFTTYDADLWRPQIEADFFLTAKQQFRLTAQWIGIKAYEDERWQVPGGDGDLLPDPTPPNDDSRDFTISRLVFQARYRWEIAPLSDLFIVYTRGSNLPSDITQDFGSLLRDSWTDPAVDVLVVKLRYRLGT